MQFKLLLFFILALLVVVFSMLNPQSVALNFGFWTAPEVPMAAVIIVAVAIGALITGLVNLPAQLRHGLKSRELARRVEQLEESLQKETDRANQADQRLEEFLAAASMEAGREGEEAEEGEVPTEQG